MFLKLKSKINSVRCMSRLLLILLMLYPLGVALSSTMGYTFELFNDTAYASMIAIVAAYTVALSFKAEKNSFSKVLAVVAPISLITSVFFLLNVMSPWIVIIMAVCVGCCIYLTWISVKPKVLKVISLLLVALLILPIGFLGFIALVFGGIGKDTVIQSVPSPSGKYYAELIDSDQGAFGGDTLVDVHHSKQINALLFQIEKEPQRVYRGEWGEFEDMEIYWKDDHCLVINSVEYIVD